jgi:hypothetical protein
MTFEQQFNQWMAAMNAKEHPDKDIIAFNFGLFETIEGFTIYLIGTKEFDEDDGDWAIEPDYEPAHEYLEINPDETEGLQWNDVLKRAVDIITRYVNSEEFHHSILKDAKAITTGFDDGDLTRIR